MSWPQAGIPTAPPELRPDHPARATLAAVFGLGRMDVDAFQVHWGREVIRAAAGVPPYRDLWSPEAVTAALAAGSMAEALAHLPVLGNDALRAVPLEARRTRPPPPGTELHRTSGSTGGRLHMEYTPGGAWWLGVVTLGGVRNRHVRPWDRRMSIGDSQPVARRGAFGRAVSFFWQGVWGDSAEQAARVRRRRPAVLSGPGKSLVAVGHLMWEAGYRPGRWPRAVTTFGEVLEDHTRAAIGELFGVEPVDVYGATETGPIAHQCAARDLYHLVPATVAVECLDAGGSPVPPGQSGDLVLTNVWNTLTPTVRYRIEDRATVASRPCACGHAGPALVSIDGRTWDWLWDGAGGRIPPQRLWPSHLFTGEELALLRACRVRQDHTGAVLIEVVGDLPAAAYESCRRRAAEVFQDCVPVTVRAVTQFDIPALRWRSVASDYWRRPPGTGRS